MEIEHPVMIFPVTMLPFWIKYNPVPHTETRFEVILVPADEE